MKSQVFIFKMMIPTHYVLCVMNATENAYIYLALQTMDRAIARDAVKIFGQIQK